MIIIPILILFSLNAFSVSLDSSILIFNDYDLSICKNTVDRVERVGAKRINFIPTIYVSLDGNRVKQYFYKDSSSNSIPLSHSELSRISRKLNECIEYSKSKDLDFIFSPHLDHVEHKTWRFYFDFDPSQRLMGMSYEDILVALSPETSTHYFLTSELKTSYSRYHSKYFDISKRLNTKHKVGHNFNFNQNDLYPSYEYDFVGISNYLPVSRYASKSMFETQLHRVKRELMKVGMHGIPLFYNEIGLGGKGSFEEMLIAPYAGIGGQYDYQSSPWSDFNKRIYRRDYFRALLSFLGDTSELEGVFLWNLDSFDVQGIYHYTRGHHSEEIIQLIKTYNQKVQ